MYDALGLGWGNSLLGFIALALAPLPFWISKQLPVVTSILLKTRTPCLKADSNCYSGKGRMDEDKVGAQGPLDGIAFPLRWTFAYRD